ncbi:serine hydrolase domain-containing protein [Streptococcus sanguinis]|uniref:FmtA family protein n=1 Tax=Streptococcus sanguinis SK115 TaxID=888810 RepID=F0I6R6_STRSA|nr:serine hydrolase domain-containing protein [Streptococcus sanguinis]EGD32566.1 FmtA family protein [Streptococcus sanguinis SK115]MBZ2052036.1 beta-lactamase family protein [Streptococcus sanguinis]
MKKTFILTLLTILTLGLFRPATALAEEQKLPSGTERDKIGQKIQDYVKEHEKTTAGMATAVFDKEGTIYQGNFGFMDKEKGLQTDDNSVFEWGSVTKLTVWVSVMQLWEEGKINLEEDIRTYLPEGFLRNLRYDKPITMLNLMNHQSGFDEAPLYMQGDKSLEDLLLQYQPIQSFEPGTTTAYSNYSTGLAAYIVERISRQSFVDYAHKHIFKPLGMERTAIAQDLSDNAYVQAKRKQVKGYAADGSLLGDALYEVGLYPVGRATGTLSDLQKFAQALLSRKTLFARSETWDKLYTGTSYYPGTDIVRNAHGFWASEFAVTVLGHGGNTNGFSSFLRLDLKNGIGQVIMTNQGLEEIYNGGMPELIFGKRPTASAETQKKFEPGYYQILRNFNQGPLSLYQLFPGNMLHMKKPSSERMDHLFWTIYKSGNGKTRIATPVSDLERLPDWEIWTKFGLIALAALSLVYALVNLLMRLALVLYRLAFGKVKSKQNRAWKWWHILTTAGVVTVACNLLLLLLSFNATDLSIISQWRYMVFAGLGLFLAGCAVYPLFSKAQKGLRKGRLFLTVLTSLSALAIVANILYWSLYQWWVM